nr:MAG TPA: hypothetical protein [Caudoviricetes sp.]
MHKVLRWMQLDEEGPGAGGGLGGHTYIEVLPWL